MGSTPIFEVRPDPKESFCGGFGPLVCFLIGRLRPGVLFYFRSVFDFQMMALCIFLAFLLYYIVIRRAELVTLHAVLN